VPAFDRLLLSTLADGIGPSAAAQSTSTLTARMATHLTLICHVATAAMRAGAFATADDPIEEVGRAQAAAVGPLRVDLAWTSPALAARQTAAALGLDAVAAPGLRACDSGRWAGRRLEDLQRDDPHGLAAWLTDPGAAPHGGETLVALMARVAAWLDDQTGHDSRVVAVTHQEVIRAAVARALDAPPSACLRIDVAPLSRAILSFNRQWRLQALGPF
jgi:broad specificity phosphatase PhoE